ncbi:MAG TPA: hypothetical protein VE641_15530 [Chthoniobacterales bacterium]|jgi:uncharacterized membrane protein|nr:hypothetical protein [Chthoniobacterales bacterium]
MKTKKSIHADSIRRLLVVVPVILIAFAACSDLAGTAQNQSATTNRVGTYFEPTRANLGDQSAINDLDPAYEWSY